MHRGYANGGDPEERRKRCDVNGTRRRQSLLYREDEAAAAAANDCVGECRYLDGWREEVLHGECRAVVYDPVRLMCYSECTRESSENTNQDAASACRSESWRHIIRHMVS